MPVRGQHGPLKCRYKAQALSVGQLLLLLVIVWQWNVQYAFFGKVLRTY